MGIEPSVDKRHWQGKGLGELTHGYSHTKEAANYSVYCGVELFICCLGAIHGLIKLVSELFPGGKKVDEAIMAYVYHLPSMYPFPSQG
jgi:hypothetical protein